MQWLINKYDSLSVQKIPTPQFVQHLLYRRDSWFLEVGSVGVIFFTAVIPRSDATFNAVFWDKRLTLSRVEIIKSAVTTAFDVFALDRLSAMTPWSNKPMRRVLTEVGFKLEGTVRRGWNKTDDLLCFGMLREELPCLAVPLPTITSD